jgi:RHS repeat-associated protein
MKIAKSWLILPLLLLFGVARPQSSVTTYIYTDPQGTPLAEADGSGAITATYDYRPHGSLALGNPPNGPGYTSHVNDPDTGLVYMQQRYYDPVIGRLLSVDPVGVDGAAAKNFNRYSYADNNPYKYIDPDGRSVTCTQSACYIDSHSVVEAFVDHAIVDVIYIRRVISNARTNNQQHSQEQPLPPTNSGSSSSDSGNNGSEGASEAGAPAAPALPTGLVGEAPRATGKNGGAAVGTSLPADQFADTVKTLTGGTLGQPDSKGRSTSPNGVAVRTGGKNGPRIDVPANGTKPPEIIHFPENTPIPDHLQPKT